jgi:UDP-N-acetyl-D-galactosamine dehydrogenase
VGGHCIGVDPYYLTHKAQAIGYQPEIILAGRRLNDSMGAYVVKRVIKLLMQRHSLANHTRVLVLGLTFKENCPDLRNTRVVDMVQELKDYGISVDVHDPWAIAETAREELGIELVAEPSQGAYDAVILAVAHREFGEMGATAIRAFCKPGGVLFDVKHILSRSQVDGRL